MNILGKSVFKFCKTTNILHTIKTIIQDHIFCNNHTYAKAQTLISMQPQYLVNITCPCTLRPATHRDIYVAHLEVFCWYSTARTIVQRSERVLHKSETNQQNSSYCIKWSYTRNTCIAEPGKAPGGGP